MDEKNNQVNEIPLSIDQLEVVNNVGKIEEGGPTGYVAYAEEAQTYIEQETEANSTGYEVTL